MYMYTGIGEDGPKCGHFFVKSPLKISAKMLTSTAVTDSVNTGLMIEQLHTINDHYFLPCFESQQKVLETRGI